MQSTLFPDWVDPTTPIMTQRKYLRQCQIILLRAGLSGEEVCADDVHRVLPTPEGIHPSTIGIIFHELSKAGVIAPTRFIRSSRPCRHCGILRQWRIRAYPNRPHVQLISDTQHS